MNAPQLERYDVVGELGRGGMSVVYRAHDRQLDRSVALKVLHHFLAEDPDARRRLRREAVAVARLRHPGIVEIYDSSEPEAEDAYLVTELIDGVTLRAWLDDHDVLRLPEATAVIGLTLAQALRHAHERGIVHRDLKPENVMVTRSGQLKLMDFGIAQIMGGATRLTTTGALLGSPAHMPPEIIDGLPSDHRSDLFSLGTILYSVACGRLPFEAPNPSALFRRILEGEYEPPQAIAPAVGNGLARILTRALERNPDDRYQDVSELEADLSEELETVAWEPTPGLLAELLNDPERFCAGRREALLGRLIEEGRSALGEKRVARACDLLNRAAAMAPENAEVLELLESASCSEAGPPRRARKALLWAVGMCAAGLAVAAVSGQVTATGGGRDASPQAPFGVATAASSPSEGATHPPDLEDEASSLTPAPKGVVVAKAPPSKRATIRRGETKTRASSPKLRVEPKKGPGRPARLPVPAPEVAPPRLGAQVHGASPARDAVLRIRVGQSFADIHLNGVPELRNRYRGELRLEPGVHTVEVVKPGVGRFAPRRIEVSSEGEVWEKSDNGGKRAVPGQLLDFRVPLSAAEARDTPGWVSD